LFVIGIAYFPGIIVAQRLLNRLFQDTELGNIIRENEPLLIEVLNEDAELSNVIRDSEPLLIEVLNEERELVIVDNNTREVRNADDEQASINNGSFSRMILPSSVS
jgi:3-polyprenyl-4-hydroxybenzoate decarboxylase